MRQATTTTYDTEVAAVAARIRQAQERELADWRQASEGVVWSGLASPHAPIQRSDAEIVAQARAEVDGRIAFQASPRGRFLAALRDMSGLGHNDQADRLQSLYSRSLGDDREPLNRGAVELAFKVLAEQPSSPAAEAVLALEAMVAAEAPAQRAAA